ncbi:hypothetical protein ES702_05560 [subsurface metagenome]
MWFCSIVVKLLLIFSVLGAPFLAVVGYMVLWFKSMSLTFRLHSSMGLNPVSLLVVSLVDVGLWALAISMFRFSVVGTRLSFISCLYFGFSKSIL